MMLGKKQYNHFRPMTWVFICVLTFYVTLGLRMMYVKYLKSNNILVGPDARQIADNHAGFVVASYTFNRNFSNSFVHVVKERLINLMTTNSTSCIFLNTADSNPYRYSTRDLSTMQARKTLADKIIVDHPIPSWGQWRMIDIPIKIYIYQNTIKIMFNHAYFDGYAVLHKVVFTTVAVETTPWVLPVPSFKYIPLLTEWNTIKSGIQLYRLPHRYLHTYEWQTRTSAQNIVCAMSQSIIKQIKNTNKTTYPIALAAFMLSKIFSCMTPSKSAYLNVCLVSVLDNNTCFNNIGVVSVCVKYSTNVVELCSQLSRGIRSNQGQVLTTYMATNIFDMQTGFYEKVDVVFSSMPVSKGKVLVDGDAYMVGGDLEFPYSTCPIYIYCFSYHDRQECCINVQTNQIDKSDIVAAFQPSCYHVKLGKNILR